MTMSADLAIKEPCLVATTGNITLSGLQTVDGVALGASNRVLVKSQTTASQNGIYAAASGAWTRATDFDGAGDVVGGAEVRVTSGTKNADSSWRVAGDGAVNIGTDSIAFEPEFLQAGSGAVGRTAQSKLRETFSVRDFGAVGDGSTDDTAAFTAAIAAISDVGLIKVPAGVYKVTSTVAVGEKRILIAGDAIRASQILFAPTADDTCIEFGGAGSPSYEQGIRDLTITSNDSTYAKILLNLRDCSNFALDNVALTGGVSNGLALYLFGGTGGSIALKMNGRDTSTFSNLFISAQRPIVLGPNANNAIAVDHINFENLYMLGSLNGSLPTYAAHTTDYPLVEIEDSPMAGSYPYSTNVSNLSFTGRQAWVGGGYGVYWNDTTATSVSNNVLFENVRREGSHNIAKHVFYISHADTNLHGLTFRNIFCGLHGSDSVPGLYARKIAGALLLEQFNYVGIDGAKNGLDIDATVTNTQAVGCHFAQGGAVSLGKAIAFTAGQAAGVAVGNTITGLTSSATATVTHVSLTGGSFAGNDAAGWLGVASQSGTFVAGEALRVSGTTRATAAGDSVSAQRKVYWGSPYPSASAPVDFELQTIVSTNTVVQSQVWQKGQSVTLADNQVHVLGETSLQGFLMIDSSIGVAAIYHLQGGVGNTKEISDPDGYFNPTYNSAGQISIGYDSSQYKIKNRLGSSVTLSMYMIGPGVSGAA
jgi:Pectate lyase superfamily protein